MQSFGINIKERFAQRFGFSPSKGEVPVDVEETERQKPGRNHGPRPVRHVTAGQLRRAEARWRKGQIRKTNLRHRRQWHLNQQAIANLRGQIAVLDAGADHPLYDGVEQRLYDAYGSADKAREVYAEIEAKQAEARVQAALADLGKR